MYSHIQKRTLGEKDGEERESCIWHIIQYPEDFLFKQTSGLLSCTAKHSDNAWDPGDIKPQVPMPQASALWGFPMAIIS